MHYLYEIIYGENSLREVADFCNDNNYMLIEIAPDKNGRRFQIVELPSISEEEKRALRIGELKDLLRKYKEDVEQVELFGMERNDYAEKKAQCAEIIKELRALEKG